MHLDVATLSLATVFVMALLGALLAVAGLQNRAERALIVWAGGYVGAAAGIGLVMARGSVPDWLSIEFANALTLFGVGLVWVGARVFERLPLRLVPVIALPALWLVACAVPVFRADINLRIVLVALLGALPALAAARDLAHGRAEPLISRWPTVWVLLAYAAISLARIPVTVMAPLTDSRELLSGPWLAYLAFGSLLFTMVLAFLLLNLVKERSELKHKIAATIDPLSGVANRRALLDGAEWLLRRQSRALEPLAAMVFDLDRFKQVNDRFGHSAGDSVLTTFAAIANRILGGAGVFGRLGGEEFAAVLAVADLDEAVTLADRVRREFAMATVEYGHDTFSPSVSAGVVLACDPHRILRDMLAEADAALYRAKAAGRNRVEAGDASKPTPAPRPETDPGNRRAHRLREVVSA
ncbi:MAG: GGDEF domain-containing protein [Pseudolabrys sp.]